MERLGAVEGGVEGGGAGAGFCANAAGTRSPIVSASPTKMRKRRCTDLFLCLISANLRVRVSSSQAFQIGQEGSLDIVCFLGAPLGRQSILGNSTF